MSVTPELHAQILRHYHVERWRTGTIARQLQVHHGTIERVLRQTGLPGIRVMRASRIDPYLPPDRVGLLSGTRWRAQPRAT
jgi:hypothetical protein